MTMIFTNEKILKALNTSVVNSKNFSSTKILNQKQTDKGIIYAKALCIFHSSLVHTNTKTDIYEPLTINFWPIDKNLRSIKEFIDLSIHQLSI